MAPWNWLTKHVRNSRHGSPRRIVATPTRARADARRYGPGAAPTVRHRCARSSPHRHFSPCSLALRWSAATPPSIRCCAPWRKRVRLKIPAISFTRCRMVNSADTCLSTIQPPNWRRARSARARTVSSEMRSVTVSIPPGAFLGELISRPTAAPCLPPRSANVLTDRTFATFPQAGIAAPADGRQQICL